MMTDSILLTVVMLPLDRGLIIDRLPFADQTARSPHISAEMIQNLYVIIRQRNRLFAAAACQQQP